jgi:aminopeptidase 2
MSEKVEFKRLPLNVLPVNYAVSLKPNFNDFTFDGHVIIDLDVRF